MSQQQPYGTPGSPGQPGQYQQQPYAGQAPPPTSSGMDDRTMILLSHLAILVPFGFLLPLIVWSQRKDMDWVHPETKFQLQQAWVWQVGILIVSIIGWTLAGILSVVLIGFLLMPVVAALNIAGLIYGIIGAVKCSSNQYFEYPWAGKWAREQQDPYGQQRYDYYWYQQSQQAGTAGQQQAPVAPQAPQSPQQPPPPPQQPPQPIPQTPPSGEG